ncbi:aspartyl/asparaginyl beta-hydroxylase domain-containing protein [Pinirhizobacter sp.]|jgi:hypothetical protein|uniref:aspartyl/asparaginyl beta-hydroxylase domain-containing protein n=1 Tax=Pinirhizobacter sp. TaxID=2950432 RepID=UPI002F40C08C
MSSRIIANIDFKDFDFTSAIQCLGDIPFQLEEYDEFGQGQWSNISLYNESGLASDTQYRNAKSCRSTPHCLKVPEIISFIEENFDTPALRMVRARNLVDGMVIPHRDFVELDEGQRYLRVFVPLEDNLESFHSDDSGVFRMRRGEVWMLDASQVHAAINFGRHSRMFLCLDFAFDRPFHASDIFSPGAGVFSPGDPLYIQRSAITQQEIDQLISSVAGIINPDTFRDVLFALSKVHFRHDVEAGACYDWIEKAARRSLQLDIVEKTNALRRYLVDSRDKGQRFSINDWARAAA